MSKNKLHSSYWLGKHSDDDTIDLASKGTSQGDIIKLATIKNAISNFVRIVTGRSIPVHFNSGNQSYTTGDVVVISASTKEKTFDAVVGLALHESTHCVWREFPDFLRNELHTYSDRMIPQFLKDKAGRLNYTGDNTGTGKKMVPSDVVILLKNLMNVYEDRRIDWWLYREAPGYRPYYEALYKQYWHSRQIDLAFQQGIWNEPTVENYMEQLINMTNQWFDTDALPNLDLIYGSVDVNNIKRFDGDKGWKYSSQCYDAGGYGWELDKMPKIWQLAVSTLDLIFDECLPKSKELNKGECENDQGEGDDTMEDNLDSGVPGEGEGEDEGEGAEGGSSSGKGSGRRIKRKAAPKPKSDGKRSPEKLKRDLAKQKKFLDGKTDKKKIAKNIEQQVKAVQEAGAHSVQVEYDSSGGSHVRSTEVIVMRKLSMSILASGAYPFTGGMQMVRSGSSYRSRNGWKMQTPYAGWQPSKDHYSTEAVTEGFRLGRILSNRLAVRNQNQITKFNRRPMGKVDKRRLASIGSGEENVFYNLRMTEYKPVLAHMSLDASSSMQGPKWQKSLATGIAVAVAAETIDNLDFVLSMRAGTGEHATIAIIYDSRVDKTAKIKTLFPYLTTIGNTPEGLCFAAILDDLIAEKHGDRYFINLSDGMPWFGEYSGETSFKHTREQVTRLRNEGLKVLSYFITEDNAGGYYSNGLDDKRGFGIMYGQDASYIDVSKLGSLSNTLNSLFLKR